MKTQTERRPRVLSSGERTFLLVASQAALHSHGRHREPQDYTRWDTHEVTFQGRRVRPVVMLRLLNDGILTVLDEGLVDITPYGMACAEKSRLKLGSPDLPVEQTLPVDLPLEEPDHAPRPVPSHTPGSPPTSTRPE